MSYGIQKALNLIAGTVGLGDQAAANAAIGRINGIAGQKPSVALLAVDKAITTTATFTDVVSVSLTPNGTAVTVSALGMASMSTTASVFYEIYTGATHKSLGSVSHASSTQVHVGGRTLFTGLTAGTPYTFTFAVKVGSGTWNCRAAAFPANEQMCITAEDAL